MAAWRSIAVSVESGRGGWRTPESIVSHANNRKIWLNLRDRFPHPYTARDAQIYLKHVVLTQPEINFAIDVAGEAVGGVGFVLSTDVERHSAEVGYWLGESDWRRGIATAALKGSTNYAMAKYDLWRSLCGAFQ